MVVERGAVATFETTPCYQHMEIIDLPLLHYDLDDGSTLGLLVGTPLQMVEKDLRSLKKSLTDYLQKQYKRTFDYPDTGLESAKLKMLDISLRPTYWTKNGVYPSNQPISLKLPAVYGPHYQGFYTCYLPLIEKQLHFYEEWQFPNIAMHFTTNLLHEYQPERLYRLAMYPSPKLEIIQLKVDERKALKWFGNSFEREPKALKRLAEQYPYPKALRKQLSNLPQAAWELELQVSDVVEKLIRQKANVLIVGKEGVGKTAVLQQAIRKIHALSKKQKTGYTFWRIMAQRVTASAQYLGDWQAAVEELIDDLQMVNGILWVEDLIRLLQTGGSGPEDSVAAFLLSYLQDGELQLVGELTPTQLDSMRRLLPGFAESFQIVEIPVLEEDRIHNILKKFAQHVKMQDQIEIPKSSRDLAFRLLARYFPYEQFPGKGIKFLGQCVNDANLKNKSRVTKGQVIEVFIRQTGMPELFLRDDLLLDQQALQKFFQDRIIGQDTAVNQLCDIIKIFKAGLNNPYKPITTLLFAGPTGVGKTASAKALADYFFGQGQNRSPMVRIDMSEFQFPHLIYRLIGDGRNPGQLIREIRERPFSVLLLDEVEKAHPSVFDALLNVLDEGVMVDAFGRLTNFRNTIIILTTNLGASNRKSIGFQETLDESSRYESAIRRFFRPEFVNRIEQTVLFHALDQQAIRAITRKELKEIQNREGFKKQQIKLRFTKQLIDRLVAIGFDERYGARPLQRTIEQEVVHPLADWLLENPKVTAKTLKVDFEDGTIQINS